MTVHIDRQAGQATLYGGSGVTIHGSPGVTLTFRPRSAKHVLPDHVIRQQLYRTHVDNLERKAEAAINNARADLSAASSLSRHEVKDEHKADRNAARAHVLRALLPSTAA